MIKWGTVLAKEGLIENSSYVRVFDMVSRDDFVPEEYKKYSYSDEPVPIPYNQTQSAPHMDAIFVNYGKPSSDDLVLEIGTGSGYLTAILSFLCKRVVSIEYFPGLSRWASKNISNYKINNVDLIIGNINKAPIKQRFDLIISTASFRREPDFLKKLMKQGGRVIFPIGAYPPQQLVRYMDDRREELASVAFVNIID
ncbi:MAG: protein-L-isoaspartate O-methyltransferase family protein [Thermoplasmata archaeon]